MDLEMHVTGVILDAGTGLSVTLIKELGDELFRLVRGIIMGGGNGSNVNNNGDGYGMDIV